MRKINRSLILAGTLIALVAADAAAQTAERRARGWVRDSAAVLATIPVAPRYRAFLPEEVDLSERFPVPGNQGQQGSCVAWATGYALRSYYEGQRRNWSYSSSAQLISPAYIYNRLHNYPATCHEGTVISEALNLLKNEGAPTLAAFPYSSNSCSRRPDPEVTKSGAEFRIRSWHAINHKKLDDAKGQLNRGVPVVFGLDLSDDFDHLEGDAIYDNADAPRTGGHAMVLVGYSESRQAFKVINSWGTGWGDKGFGWISYNVMQKHAENMFVMDVPEYTPPPEPPKPVVVVPPTPTPEPPKPVVVVPPTPTPEPPKPVVVVPPTPTPEPPKPVVVVPPTPTPTPEPPKPVVVVPPTPTPEPPKPVVVVPPTPTPEPPKPVVVVPPTPTPEPPKPVVVVPPTPTPVPPKPVVVVPPKPVPPAPVVVPPVASVQAQLAQRLRQVQCARIEGSVGADRVVHLRGFGGSADELAKLNDELRAMPGVNRVDANVTLHAWPQCEVYLNFADALNQPRAMTAQARGAAGAAFTEGDSLSIELQTPDYPSYLYVTYLQASGEAVHLYWPQSKFPKAIPPRTKITLGGGAKGEPVYRIGGPFGDEIIVVIASASPLFVDELPATATDREYLTSFRKAFLVQPKGGGGQRIVSAVALPLVTKPKN